MTRHRTATAWAAVLATFMLTSSASAAGTVSVRFDQQGEHPFVVPEGVSMLTVVASGEEGGRGDSFGHGGTGAEVTATLPVTPKRTYWAQVDVGGGAGGSAIHPGGDGGGAAVFRACASDAVTCDGYADSRLIVAAGGGGAGGASGHIGGGGRFEVGGTESGPGGADYRTRSVGGGPGTGTQGGAAGYGESSSNVADRFLFGTDGMPGAGGRGGESSAPGAASRAYGGGGGGGGGWFGGGGGGASRQGLTVSGAGGGGGSNHVDASIPGSSVAWAKDPNASVVLSWTDDRAPRPSISARVDETMRGRVSTALGDRPDVDVAIYEGDRQGESDPVQTMTTQAVDGAWSVQPAPLAPDTYTVVVTQRDWADNAGTTVMTFDVAPTVPPTAASTTQEPSAAPAPDAPAEPTPESPSTQAPSAPAAEAPAGAAPLPAPSASAAATAGSTPQAATPPRTAASALRIVTAHARLVRGALSVRLSCAGARCSGTLTLTAKGKRVGSARYDIPAGRAATVRVRIRPASLPRRLTAAGAGATRTITVT